MHWRLLGAAGLALAIAAPLVGATESPTTPQPKTVGITTPKAPLRNGCSKLYNRSAFRRVARTVYRSPSHVTRHEKRVILHVLHCQQTARSERWARHLLKKWKKRHKVVVEWHYYKTHPMPWCTWGPESGGNYRAKNPTSTAGGKYQILDGTWYANGGSHGYPLDHPAAYAPPLEQERVGHTLYRRSGGSPWVNC